MKENTDPIRYAVNDCYHSIQGEGSLTGVPMIVLRLHGCMVGCPWCDTRETWIRDPLMRVDSIAGALGSNPRYVLATAEQIGDWIRERHAFSEWILLTGGEPAEQELGELVDTLARKDFNVALETSGTAKINASPTWLTLSPKIGMPGGRSLEPTVIRKANELKWVVGKPEHLQDLRLFLREHRLNMKRDLLIYLQPLSQTEKATRLCIEAAHHNPGWRVSLQAHKYAGIRLNNQYIKRHLWLPLG